MPAAMTSPVEGGDVENRGGAIAATTDGGGSGKEASWFSQFRNGSNPWMARYVYGLMFLASNLLAWVVRDYGHSASAEMSSTIALHYFLLLLITKTNKLNFLWKN